MWLVKMKIKVIGAGLAGSEASYQLAKLGFEVELYEQKPVKFSPAHKSQNFAELVCSNSLKSNDLTNACGLLKEELRILDSVAIKTADEVKVPSGEALGVDRELFSQKITQKLKSMPNITIKNECVEEIDFNEPTIIATGPLTDGKLLENIKQKLGKDDCYFFDAVAPIVTKESLDAEKYFVANRYDKGGADGDYINCPMTKEEYDKFYSEIINAKTVELHDFENKKVFESCMPIEVSAKRGYKTLLFGILKPKGLVDPKTDKMPYAVLQLRKESNFNSLYNLVGCQTNMTFGEQKRIFALIPELDIIEYSSPDDYYYFTRDEVEFIQGRKLEEYIDDPELWKNEVLYKEKPSIETGGINDAFTKLIIESLDLQSGEPIDLMSIDEASFKGLIDDNTSDIPVRKMYSSLYNYAKNIINVDYGVYKSQNHSEPFIMLSYSNEIGFSSGDDEVPSGDLRIDNLHNIQVLVIKDNKEIRKNYMLYLFNEEWIISEVY